MRERMESKAKKACEELRQIISWEKEKRYESEAVWEYRRRVLPIYLLQECTRQRGFR